MSKKAFTLIECVIAVVIIAVLMALLMPALAKARATAQAERDGKLTPIQTVTLKPFAEINHENGYGVINVYHYQVNGAKYRIFMWRDGFEVLPHKDE